MDTNLDSMLIESELIVPVSIEFRDDLTPEDFEHLCRLCGNSSPQLMPIFSDDGNEHNLSEKIEEHLPIIKVSRTDVLPLSICYQCASTLISWHELYYACKDADERLKEISSRFKFEKSDSYDNVMEVHDDEDYKDTVDSFGTIDLPKTNDINSKPEVIVPHAVSEITAHEMNDSSSGTKTVECPNMIPEFSAVDNEVNISSITETRNRSPDMTAIVSIEMKEEASNEPPLSPSADAASTLLTVAADCRLLNPPKVNAFTAVALPHPRTDATGRYQCNKCDRRFSSRVFLNMHYNEGRVVFANPATFHELYALMRSNPLVPPDRIDPSCPFVCAHCDQKYNTKAELRTHIYCYHPSVKKFRCDFCTAHFVTECDLAEHRVAHSGERQLICLTCGKRRATGSLSYETNRSRIAFEMCVCKSSRQQPRVVLTESVAAASAVSRRRRNAEEREREALQREERKRQRQEALDALGTVCQECGKEFATRLSLKRHHRMHKNPMECEFCGKRYGRAYMKNHLLIHGQEKKYVCQKCGKGFAQLSSLRSHQLLEENVRKFVCNVCGMRFVLSSRFHSHMKTHLEEPPFKCAECGRGYGYIWQLRQHMVRHSDVRPYACEQCGRAYKTMKHLRQHYVVHTREVAS